MSVGYAVLYPMLIRQCGGRTIGYSNNGRLDSNNGQLDADNELLGQCTTRTTGYCTRTTAYSNNEPIVRLAYCPISYGYNIAKCCCKLAVHHLASLRPVSEPHTQLPLERSVIRKPHRSSTAEIMSPSRLAGPSSSAPLTLAQRAQNFLADIQGMGSMELLYRDSDEVQAIIGHLIKKGQLFVGPDTGGPVSCSFAITGIDPRFVRVEKTRQIGANQQARNPQPSRAAPTGSVSTPATAPTNNTQLSLPSLSTVFPDMLTSQLPLFPKWLGADQQTIARQASTHATPVEMSAAPTTHEVHTWLPSLSTLFPTQAQAHAPTTPAFTFPAD